jgi:hypothetical protein
MTSTSSQRQMLRLVGCSLVPEPRPPTGAVLLGESDSPFDYGDRGRFQALTARLGERVHQVQRVIDGAMDLRGDVGYRLRDKRDAIRSGQVVYSHTINTTPPTARIRKWPSLNQTRPPPRILIAGRVPARSLSATRDATAPAGDYPPLTFPSYGPLGPRRGVATRRGSAPGVAHEPTPKARRKVRSRASVRGALARLPSRRRCGR